jgi:crotonobetainyl-CoA:carnitine CoA-transferase CaiB-like acyl-CoA transferase
MTAAERQAAEEHFEASQAIARRLIRAWPWPQQPPFPRSSSPWDLSGNDPEVWARVKDSDQWAFCCAIADEMVKLSRVPR